MKKSERKLLVISLVIFVVVIVVGICITVISVKYFNMKQAQIDEENKKNLEELNSINQAIPLMESAQSHTANAGSYDKIGDTYHNTANIMYENRNFQSCIDNYVTARGYYSKSGQEYRNAEAIWERVGELNITKLQTGVTYYIGLNSAGSNITYSISEACEGLESVCRLSSLGDYATAQSYLEQANEKITAHDYWVEIYNDYVAKIKALS